MFPMFRESWPKKHWKPIVFNSGLIMFNNVVTSKYSDSKYWHIPDAPCMEYLPIISYNYIWVILVVRVGKYSIHGAYGYSYNGKPTPLKIIEDWNTSELSRTFGSLGKSTIKKHNVKTALSEKSLCILLQIAGPIQRWSYGKKNTHNFYRYPLVN